MCKNTSSRVSCTDCRSRCHSLLQYSSEKSFRFQHHSIDLQPFSPSLNASIKFLIFLYTQMTHQCHVLSLEVSFNPVGNTTTDPIMLTPALKVSESDTVLNPVHLSADEKYNVTAQLRNFTGEIIASGFINISTFDVQDISRPVEVKLNSVCPNISFANGSMADAYVILTRIDKASLEDTFNGTIPQSQLTRQAYGCVEVARNGGTYKLSIYDIQNETTSKKPALILPDPIEVAPLPPNESKLKCFINFRISALHVASYFRAVQLFTIVCSLKLDPIASPSSTPVNSKYMMLKHMLYRFIATLCQ